MEMHVLPWIKDDIAIEIIGKMIAVQTEELYDLLKAYDYAGLDRDDPIVREAYQQKMILIGSFKAEIDDIYAGKGLDELYKKVEEVYVPCLTPNSNDLSIKS